MGGKALIFKLHNTAHHSQTDTYGSQTLAKQRFVALA